MPHDVLIVKLSSLGDVIHAFAVLGDLRRFAGAAPRVVWAAEEAFAPLAGSHPLVEEAIAVPMRRLRREKPWRWPFSPEMAAVRHALRARHFDYALDLQGLIKSAVLMKSAAAAVHAGYDRRSAREGAAALFYDAKFAVAREMHAVERMRILAGKTFGYIPEGPPDYGLPLQQPSDSQELLFFHGTTWASKLLPEETWQALIRTAAAAGWRVQLPWGSAAELARAERLAQAGAQVLPKLSLPELQAKIYASSGVISVDTGLGHLAAACGAPVLGIFAPTSAALTGMYGAHAANLSLPSPCLQRDCRKHGGTSAQACMAHWSADEIWQAFLHLKDKA